MTTLDFTLELSHKANSAFDVAAQESNFSQTAIQRGRAARNFGKSALERELMRVRRLLREWVAALPESSLSPPLVATINPPLWEAAHVAWFAEWWCVRDAYNVDDGSRFGGSRADRDSIWAGCDALLNSNTIAHEARWRLPQITREKTLDYLDRSLDATLSRLNVADESDAGLYPFRLSLFHEAMHLEALAWCAQTLAWERPAWVLEAPRAAFFGDIVELQATSDRHTFGYRGPGFSFDNERGAHEREFASITFDTGLVSNREFLGFVDSGEYSKMTRRAQPIYWRIHNSVWQQRRFDRWIDLHLDEPVIHVSAREADAYCDWVDRRLPTEFELEALFASTDGTANGPGKTFEPEIWGERAWEWTSSTFAPYPSFTADRYREYSQPWFDENHRANEEHAFRANNEHAFRVNNEHAFRVLRGGSYATLDIMHHPQYRNFFTPNRSDVFAGFRTTRK